MRLTATSITILSLLLLAGCDATPPGELREQLNGLKGPQPGSMSDTLKGQAEQAAATKDFARAAQNYRQLADKDPDNKDYTLALADSLRRAGDNQSALKVLDKYLATNPKDAAALETRGLCLLALGIFGDAGKSFEQVMAIDPTRWRTLNAVGILFTMKNKLPDAVNYYDEALDHSPDNASVLNNKAITLAMDGKYDLAIETFMKTRKNLRVGSPDMQQVDMNMALVYAISGRLDDAESTASPYLSKPALYNNMGVYAELAKNPELSRSYLNMALTNSPVYYERAWKNLGTVSNDNTTTAAPSLPGSTVKDLSDTPAPKDKKAKKDKKDKKAKKPEKKNAKKVKIDDSEELGTRLDQIPKPESGTPAPPIEPVGTRDEQ